MSPEPHHPAMYDRKLVFTAACLGMLVFGVVMTTLGTILPAVIERFDIDMARAGTLVSLLSAGILAGSVVFGPVVDRYGYRGLLLLCTALVALGLEGIAFASSLALLQPAIFLIGFGGGVINGGTNALVADISSEGRSAGLSLLGVFYGVGALSIPLLLGLTLRQGVYTVPVAIVGACALLPLLFFIAIRFPQPKQAQGFPIKDGLKLIRETTLLLLGLMLFLESGMEITVGNWTTSFLTSELGLDAADAAFFLSFFLLGMTLARLLLGGLLKKTSPARVLLACIGIGIAGALIMIFSPNLPVAVCGLFLIGV
ncbi:MAG TPA: MFS transporter, partial [Rhodothermales bacterium]|nr:MFS transporter [Rhodothermales bacterium]